MHQADRPRRRVVVANFGLDNSLWPECRARGTIAIYEDEDLRRLYELGDEAGYKRLCLMSKYSASGAKASPQTASTWWNNNKRFEASQDEVWLHRDGNLLWWTVSQPGPIIEDRRPSTGLSVNSGFVHVFHKPALPWSCKGLNGRTLGWTSLHPKARSFLQKGQGTLGYLNEPNAQYAQALIRGESLEAWHDLADWRKKAEQTGFSPVTFLDVDVHNTEQKMEAAAARMVATAMATVAGANGQIVERSVKNKDCVFASPADFKAYVIQLLKDQGGRCALTGLELKWDDDPGDEEMQPSLDRIDSDGHYAQGNLQVVCKFANFWKSNQDNATFLRLIEKVRSVKSA